MKNIVVFTGSRADFGRLEPVCHKIVEQEALSLQLIAGPMHSVDSMGHTLRTIDQTGLAVTEAISLGIEPTDGLACGKIIAETTSQLSVILQRLAPDLVLVLGDRFELLSVVSACVALRIPIGHIGGGQVTEGALDEQVRHVVSKAAHLHFVANLQFKERLVFMGEEPWRVHVTGSPSIDCLALTPALDEDILSHDLGLDLTRPTGLVTLHPESVEYGTTEQLAEEFFGALAQLPLQYVLTYPNGDPGTGVIIGWLKKFQETHTEPCVLIPQLGIVRYVSAMKHCRLMLGNSSSGLVEAPFFKLPCVNVGERQLGRLRAENVFDCAFDQASILKAVENAIAWDRKVCASPYGDGAAAGEIIEILSSLWEVEKSRLLRKTFYTGS